MFLDGSPNESHLFFTHLPYNPKQFPAPQINHQREHHNNQFIVLECPGEVQFHTGNRCLEYSAPPALMPQDGLEQTEGLFLFQHLQRLRCKKQWQ